MLPLLQGWRYINDSTSPMLTLTPGESRDLFEQDNIKGYINAAFLSVSNPNAEVEIVTDGYHVKTTLANVNTLGLIQPAMIGSQMFYLAKYDTVNSIYTGVWAPALPSPFAKHVKFAIKAPAGAIPTIVYSFFICWLKIEEEALFRKSLSRVTKGLD